MSLVAAQTELSTADGFRRRVVVARPAVSVAKALLAIAVFAFLYNVFSTVQTMIEHPGLNPVRVFLSTRGEVSARFKASYDWRITQRIVVQPRAETTFGLSHEAAPGVNWGLAEAEAGLRVRYHFKREFAPYVGVEWRRTTPRSGEVAIAHETTNFVIGVRAWF